MHRNVVHGAREVVDGDQVDEHLHVKKLLACVDVVEVFFHFVSLFFL